ncbi:MAG: transporter [Proteobacteria bacterium]|nr:transporter [Pseudomonadota bacterium]
MSIRQARGFALLFLLFIVTSPAWASCGVGNCSVDTGQEIQAWQDGLISRLDLRYDNYTLDQPRFGTRPVGVGEIRRHHDEIRTRNQNLWLNADIATSRNWGFSVVTPYVLERAHDHVHNHHGHRFYDGWNLSGIGDMRVLGRYQSNFDPASRSFWGVKLGFKLPTGSTSDRNSAGSEAERMLQPGTGSLDVLAGGYFNQAVGKGNGWFGSVMVQSPLTTRDKFRPGQALYVDLGYRQKLDDHWSAFLQGNLQVQGQDQGANAEPPQSGGTYFFITPGVQCSLSKSVQVYGFVQLPVYQGVNDVQLTRSYGVSTGLNIRL